MRVHPAPVRPHTRRRAWRNLVAIGLAAGTALSLAAAPADAARQPRNTYAFFSYGYTSTVQAGQVALASAPTALAAIGCTKLLGLTRANAVATLAQTGSATLTAGSNVERTYRTRDRSTISSSDSSLAAVDLGSSTLGLRIEGLHGTATAWASRDRRFHAATTFTFTRIAPRGPFALPAPLDQPADAILAYLAGHGSITIPTVGTVSLAPQSTSVTRTYATAAGAGLQVDLYGPDQLPGTADDVRITLVQPVAAISSGATRGVFSGNAWGIDASAVGGLVGIGRDPVLPLGCTGTGGRVVSNSLVGLDLAASHQVVVGALNQSVYGKQNQPRGGQTAWTQDQVSNIDIGSGQLVLNAITARATVVRDRRGRLHRTATQTIGSMTVGGTAHALPAPGQSVTIPGVAVVEVPAPVVSRAGLQVTGVRITLLGGSAAQTVIDLANAETYLFRR